MPEKVFPVSGTVKIFDVINPWIYVSIPQKYTKETQHLSRRGLTPVTVTLGQTTWDTALLPKGDGTQFIALKKQVRKAESVEIGKPIKLTFKLR